MFDYLNNKVVAIDGVEYMWAFSKPSLLRTFWFDEPNPTTIWSNWGQKLADAGRQLPQGSYAHKFGAALTREKSDFGKGIRAFDGFGGFEVDDKLRECGGLNGSGAIKDFADAALYAVRSVLDGGNPHPSALTSLVYVETGVILARTHKIMLGHLVKKLLEDPNCAASITSPRDLASYLEGWEVPQGPGRDLGPSIKIMRSHFEKVIAIWGNTDRPLPDLAEACLPVIQANPVHSWLESHGPYDLQLYYARSIGKEEAWLQQQPETEVEEALRSLAKDIAGSGCRCRGKLHANAYMSVMAAQHIPHLLRQASFLGDLKAAARQNMNEDDDEDGSPLNIDTRSMASPAPDAAPGSCARRLAAATRSRQQALPIRVQYHPNDGRRQHLADNESVLQAAYRTPDLETCQLEPSQLALDAYTSASGSAVHDRGVGSLRATARAFARLLDAAEKDDILNFFDSAATRREPWVLAATQSTKLLLIISMSVAGAVFHKVFYDGKQVSLGHAITRARAGISSRWQYSKLQESKRRRDVRAGPVPPGRDGPGIARERRH
ncbi:hypothetical protein A1Q2_08197 [Trichosporon asahii var. asahii CBS 8904]|uniref:Uncharacterized protein n=1 Tax=Trichosporon asahii var. asahii (strain CBS 8904) TaxID=1220162 RepID=K1V9P6_TRIAC|nr:hypothetical protein A1Q2_08197 [Trichosporon asahii var. asahii CBS 8904]